MHHPASLLNPVDTQFGIDVLHVDAQGSVSYMQRRLDVLVNTSNGIRVNKLCQVCNPLNNPLAPCTKRIATHLPRPHRVTSPRNVRAPR